MKEIFFKGAVIAALTTGLCATSSLAATRSVALNKSIETLEPMKGIVFWPDQAKSQKDLQKSIALEFSYCLPCAVVTGERGGTISYDWSSFESLLNDIKSRGHQAIVRFRIEYPNETIKNAPNCTEGVKGATAVPNYFMTNSNYLETFSENPGGDGPTYYADWSSTALQWFYKQFYTDFAKKYDNDPRIAFVQAGFGHWAEYHIYGTTLKLGTNFPTKEYQTEFLTHLDTLFKETPWSISIDAADKKYTPIAGNKTLLALKFGLFDDSFMHKEHDISQGDGDNEKNWIALDTTRWKNAPAGGEISYYSDKDQRNFLDTNGLYSVTWESAAEKYHMTYVIGNDAPEGKFATKERVYAASSYAGYKFEITGYAVNGISAAVRVKNIGIAPLYHNAYVTVKGKRSATSLKGLLPGKEAIYTVSGISIADGESPEPSITSDKLLKDVTIPYKANLDGSAKPIEGTIEESGTTAIAGNRVNIKHSANSTRIVDLKGRAQTHSTKMPKKAYYKLQAQ